VLLVLDHSEALQAPDARDAVAELALRMPPNAQLAVASRAAPPLPVAPLRAQGAITGVGVDDLVAEIGERLDVSRNTVKTQAMSIYRKLNVSSRSEAIERVEAIGLLGR